MTESDVEGRAARRARVRRATLHLMLGVFALHGLALALYFTAGIAQARQRTQNVFSMVWIVATAITVGLLFHRVRAARRG